jgi:hypothetical protein
MRGGLWSDRAVMPDAIRRQFDEMFRGMELQFGLDIPRARFFQDDFFQDLEDQMKAGTARSQGMSMQIGPDGGVRVETKETNEEGEVETKVYEAPDMATFQQQYPGVLGRNGLGFGLRLWPGNGSMPGVVNPLPQLQPRLFVPHLQFDRDDVDAAPTAPPPGKRLGVLVREIPDGVREYLDLEAGLGLMVESVQPGTLAESLGLQSGDIVIEIGGQRIGAAADVQKALGAIGAGSKVEVRLVRKGAELSATATKADAVEQPKQENVHRLQPRKAQEDAGDSVR